MTRDELVRLRQPQWRELEDLLGEEKGRLAKLGGHRISRAVSLYRTVCADLARARGASLGDDLVTYLDLLAARAHNAIYAARPYRVRALGDLLGRQFPRSLRKAWKPVLAATLLFLVPAVIAGFLAATSPESVSKLVSTATLDQMAEMYSRDLSEGYDSGRAHMAGFYVYNNVGIAFRCFATGILFGLGSVFFLVFNGLSIGATLGYVAAAGHGRNILTFVAGHGAFELTAIIFAGAAGLMMGSALVQTKGRTRIGSLRHAAPELVRIVGGSAVMLFIAAALEAFWSPAPIPDPVKWSVAGALWLAVVAYVVFVGRPRRERSSA